MTNWLLVTLTLRSAGFGACWLASLLAGFLVGVVARAPDDRLACRLLAGLFAEWPARVSLSPHRVGLSLVCLLSFFSLSCCLPHVSFCVSLLSHTSSFYLPGVSILFLFLSTPCLPRNVLSPPSASRCVCRYTLPATEWILPCSDVVPVNWYTCHEAKCPPPCYHPSRRAG